MSWVGVKQQSLTHPYVVGVFVLSFVKKNKCFITFYQQLTRKNNIVISNYNQIIVPRLYKTLLRSTTTTTTKIQVQWHHIPILLMRMIKFVSDLWLCSPGTPIFSTNKTDKHDSLNIVEVELRTIIMTPYTYVNVYFRWRSNYQEGAWISHKPV